MYQEPMSDVYEVTLASGEIKYFRARCALDLEMKVIFAFDIKGKPRKMQRLSIREAQNRKLPRY